jgi:hypothetical protein
MTEVRGHSKYAQIGRPDIDPAELGTMRKPRRPRMGERKRDEVRFLILAGVAHAEVVRRAGLRGQRQRHPARAEGDNSGLSQHWRGSLRAHGVPTLSDKCEAASQIIEKA